MTSGVKALGSTFGGVASTGLKALTVGLGAAATGISVLTKSSVDAYASYEQLTGGVETLFKTSGDIVMKYANNAYRTAGLSANAYMDTVTSFSASLIASLDGDTAAAAEKANVAITDMSDNANKMGTSMEMIQNAYQGFAKQNYTMLDNLKLGYGGTKEEMERLLEDAEKISGIHYDISSFADITEAIHVIQTEIGITGTTAKEAATTVEGSANMMKASWENLVAGLGDKNADIDVLIDNFVASSETMFANLLPVVEKSLVGIGDLVSKISPIIIGRLPSIISDVLPQLIHSAVQLLQGLGSGILGILPSLITLISDEISSLAVDLASKLPEQIPIFIEQMLTMIQTLADTLADNAPIIIQAGFQLLQGLVQGIVKALPTLIEMLPTIVTTFANIINDNMPTIILMGIQLIIELVKGIINAIPVLIENIPKIIEAIVSVWSAFNWMKLGSKAIGMLKDGIVGMISILKNAGKNVFESIVGAIKSLPNTLLSIGKNGIHGIINGFKGMMSSLLHTIGTILVAMVQAFGKFSLKEVGKNVIKGFIDGIASMAGALLKSVGDLMGNVIESVKDVFDIHSPSRKFKWIGKMCIAGLDEPLEEYNPYDTVRKSFKANPYTMASSFAGTARSVYGTHTTVDYGRMANAMATAFERAGFKVEIGHREFGRIVREVLA